MLPTLIVVILALIVIEVLVPVLVFLFLVSVICSQRGRTQAQRGNQCKDCQ
jgi:hypothetical protein